MGSTVSQNLQLQFVTTLHGQLSQHYSLRHRAPLPHKRGEAWWGMVRRVIVARLHRQLNKPLSASLKIFYQFFENPHSVFWPHLPPTLTPPSSRAPSPPHSFFFILPHHLPLSFSLIIHNIQFVQPMYFSVWGHPLTCRGPYPYENFWLSFH